MAGKKTSFGGKLLEHVIKMLSLREFEVVDYKKYQARRYLGSQRYLVKNWPYKTIYGTPGRYEWMLISDEFQGCLECKYQNSSGSVDEKLPYICENFKRSKQDNFIVVYGGDHWQTERGEGAIGWLRRQIPKFKSDYAKKLVVCDLDDFIAFAKQTWH